jgi:hypothetical protein
MASQMNFDGLLYTILVRETRNGQTRDLLNSANATGYDLPLYTSFPPVQTRGNSAVPVVKRTSLHRPRLLIAGSDLDLRGRATNAAVYDIHGRAISAACTPQHTRPGGVVVETGRALRSGAK